MLGAATGSDPEDGDEPLVLDSVQLKVRPCLVVLQPSNQKAVRGELCVQIVNEAVIAWH